MATWTVKLFGVGNVITLEIGQRNIWDRRLSQHNSWEGESLTLCKSVRLLSHL